MDTAPEKLTKPQQTLLACIAFIAGAGVVFGDFWQYLFVTGAILLCILVYLGYKKQVSTGIAVVCLVIFTLSATYAQFRTPKPDMLYSLAPKKLELRGQVVSKPVDDLKGKTKFFFLVNEVGANLCVRPDNEGRRASLPLRKNDKWRPAKAQTIVYIYDDERKFDKITIGDHLELAGSVNRPFTATNPGQFDYKKFLNRRGIFTMTFVRDDGFAITGKAQGDMWDFLSKLDKIRDGMMNIHARTLKSPKIELLGGMVFGNHAIPVPDEVHNDFLKSGLLHLLAASGLNVGIIFGIWYFLASRLGVPFAARIVAGMLLVAVYALLTGLPPSVTRAALMLELALIAKLIDRQANNTLILVMVCVLMLLYNPLMLTDVGFQLSFIVTLGLLLFIPMLVERAKPIPEWLSGAILVPLVAQVFVVPIQAFHFNTFSVYSLLANMLVVPFVGIISFAGFAGSIVALIPVIGKPFCLIADKIADPFLGLLLYIADFASNLPGSLQYIPKPGIVTIIVFYALLLTLFLCTKKGFSRKKHNLSAVVLTFALIVLVFKGSFFVNHNLEFLFFDVGEGDAMLMKTPNNRYMLVDTGRGYGYTPAQMAIVPYLRSKGIKLDALLLTHPDSDHIGGAAYILKNIGAGMVYDNGARKNTWTYRTIQDYIAQNTVKKTVLTHGDTINLDKDLKIHVIRPDNTDKRTDNEDSLILYITYDNFSALLMADCEADSLKFLKNTVKPPVTLLKVGHHGSDNSVNETFLSFVKPKLSVISTKGNFHRTRHPDPNVIRLLEDFKSRILRTDRDYAVKITTNGSYTNVKTFKEGF